MSFITLLDVLRPHRMRRIGDSSLCRPGEHYCRLRVGGEPGKPHA